MSRTTLRLIIDVVIVALVGLVVLLLNLLGHPFRRDFYCNDESIKYPHYTSTISTLAVALGGIIIPIIVFAILEFISKTSTTHDITCFRKKLPWRVVRWLKMSGVFLFGAGASQIIVDVAKFMVGRLRPHFFAVCQPRELNTLNEICVDTSLQNYVELYECTGVDKDLIEEARLSFPSGHAALSFYSAVFTIMYLQCVFQWDTSKFLRHTCQFVLLVTAWCISLTRISDYHHHWSDVLAGIAIGSLIAILNVIFVSDLRIQYRIIRRREDMALTPSSSTRDENNMPTVSSYADQGDCTTDQINV